MKKGKLDDDFESPDGKKLTLEEAAAQAFVFFFAGYETSSATCMFALYEMALNPDIQDNVRKEVIEVLEKHRGDVTYEGIDEMELLGKVVDGK